jgi:hypothetical protein
MDWLFWYLVIGLVLGAYGKVTSGPYAGPLISEILTLMFFMVGWPLVIIWILNGHRRLWKRKKS